MPITYEDALRYMYSLTNYEVKSTFAYAPQFFDLGRVEHLLASLGNPHHRFRTVHVAGTKGKGSTCAMLASILQAAGYRTGLYTSPHLHSFRERIQVNSALIPADEFAVLTETIQPLAAQDKELTTFEVATALAFQYFAQAGVDVAVVEVGLGGRLDATNVVSPLVSVITTIGHDHMHILGHTLAEIAAEKAGIIKAGVPVVIAPQEPAALEVIEHTCLQKGAPLHHASKDWQWRGTKHSLAGQQFTMTGRRDGSANSGDSHYKGLCTPLLGKHQLRNAAVVLSTVECLQSSGLSIRHDAVRQGLRTVVWPARFEVLGANPYFVVDGAHNVDSARSLRTTLRDYFPGLQPWLVLAILSDKDIPAILRQLLPGAQGVFFARSHHPRAADPHQLQQEARRYSTPAQVVESVSLATEQATIRVGSGGLVVATGSFSTASEARERWLRLHQRPLPPLDPS